jgi:hypothetical protein
MTPGQAERLLADERRDLCVRYLHDGEDVVHLTPAPREPVPTAGWGAGVAASLVAGVLASCTPHGKPAVESYDWEEQAVAASVHDGMVIPAAEDVVGDEPCGTEEPEAEETPKHPPVKGLRKKMGKRKAPVLDDPIQGGLAEVVGDGL